MSLRIPHNHALRRLFRTAIDKAFCERRDLYSPAVAAHLSDEVLCDFLHVDRIYRLNSACGKRLEQLREMLPVAAEKEGPERQLEVDSYIGDFALFMVSFFPASLAGHWTDPEPLLSRVGGILVEYSQPIDYYTAEGRNAYGRAAETARLFDPESRGTFKRLASHFEDYQGVLGRVRRLLWERPELRELDDELYVESDEDIDEDR